MNSCVWTPDVKGKPSRLFTDLKSYLGDRSKAIELYSYASQKEVQDLLNIKNLDNNGEPVASEVIKAIGDPSILLGSEGYMKFIETEENLNKSFKTFESAFDRFERLHREYPGYAFTVNKTSEGHKVSIESLSSGINRMKDIMRRGTLYRKMKDFLNSLGFDIKESTTFDGPSRFSPEEADTNAQGLKEIIRIAKGEKDMESLPEEFSHLLIEGLLSHPLITRLLETINDEVVKRILGDSYQRYYDAYSSPSYSLPVDELLKREAAGKILAEAFKRKYLSNSPANLIQRIINAGLRKFSNENEGTIDGLIREAEDAAEDIVESFDNNSLPRINIPGILSGPTLYNLDKKVTEFQKIAEAAYLTLNKKMKIFASRTRRRGGGDTKSILAVKKMRELRDKKEYTSSCFVFLKYVLGDLRKTKEDMLKYNDKIKSVPKDSFAVTLRSLFKILINASNSFAAYEGVVNSMISIEAIDGIKDELTPEDIADIQDMASEIGRVMLEMKSVYANVREKALKLFIEYYWGKERTIDTANGPKTITVEDILSTAFSDINGMSRMINSMGDMSDPLLAVVDTIYKSNQSIRDQQVFQLVQEINAIHADYVRKTGSRDTSFMYEVDENGIPTGMIISDRDYQKYWAERRALVQSLKNEGASNEKITAKLKLFDNKHLETVEWETGVKERLPKKELYPSNSLDGLSEAQREYYDRMMAIKRKMDSLLPTNSLRTYRAVQKRASMGDAILNNIKRGKAKSAAGQAQGAVKQAVTKTEDDIEFGGETLEHDGDAFETMIDPVTGELVDVGAQRRVLVDFGGNPVARVPKFYISRLSDMNSLSTDFTDSLASYAAMAINFDQMDKIANAMEVLKDYVEDRGVYQRAGTQMLYERTKVGEEKIDRPLVKRGKHTQVYQAIEAYINRNIYGRRKAEETVHVFGKKIHYGKLGDLFKLYGTLNAMGYNIFSFLGNVTMGNTQLFVEAVGNQVSKEGFGLKNLASAIKTYFTHLPEIVSGYFSDEQGRKLPLLMQQFDALEDYFSSVNDNKSSRGATKRILGLMSPLQGMSMGEHYLHAIPMLAHLNKIKVKVEGKDKPISLFDAFEVVEKTTESGVTIHELSLPENTVTVDGTPVGKEFLQKLKRTIQDSSHKINGAYGDVDKGNADTFILGRLLMQYRQWMPAFFMNRFKTKRYNDATEKEEEGFYLTTAKFIYNNIADLFKLKFQLATRWNMLNNYQKGNIARALTEVTLFWALSLILNLSGAPDDDDPMIVNTMKYAGYRLKLELGSGFPVNLGFAKNIITLTRSPIPAMEKTDYLINLLGIWDLGETIESGKYEGWNKYLRNLYYAVPFARNFGRVYDMYSGNLEMFNPYLKNQ